MNNHVIGYIMAFLLKNCKNYCFEFFANKGSDGRKLNYNHIIMWKNKCKSIKNTSAKKEQSLNLNF